LDVAIGGAHDTPDVNAPVSVKVLVFDGKQGVAEHLRIIVVGGDNPALQSERSDDTALVVVELGDGAGTVVLEIVHLWEVGGVDQEQTGACADQSRGENQQGEENAANKFLAGDFDFG
jgi:hypothetical protein